MKMPTLKQLLHKRIIYGNDYSEIKILEFTDDYTFIKLQYETGIKEWKKIIPQDDCYVRLRLPWLLSKM